MKNNSAPRVLHIVANLDERFGGPSQCVPALCVALRRFDVYSEILTTEKGQRSANSICANNNIKIHNFPHNLSSAFHFTFGIKSKIREIAVSGGFNILHVHSIWRHSAWAASVVAQKYSLGLAISTHSTLMKNSLEKSKIRKNLVRKMYVNEMLKNAQFIHSTATQETDDLCATGISMSKIKEIPIGLVPQTLSLNHVDARNMIYEQTGLEIFGSNRIALFLARVDSRKNVLELVEAARVVLQRHPEWKLVVAGPCEDQSYLRSCKAAAGPLLEAGRIVFTGMLRGDAKAAMLAASDLFILPTKFENFGLSIGEALAVGLPVITTNTTPWQQIAQEDAGWIIPPNDIAALTSAWCAAAECEDETLRLMGERGRPLVKPFTWDAIAEKFAQSYTKILK